MTEHWARNQRLTQSQAIAWTEEVSAKWDADDQFPSLWEIPKCHRETIMKPWKKNRDRFNIFKLLVRNGASEDYAAYWALSYRTPAGTIGQREDTKSLRHIAQMKDQWTARDPALTGGRVWSFDEGRPVNY